MSAPQTQQAGKTVTTQQEAASLLDQVIMRLMDALLAFPALVLALALVAALGPSLQNAIIAVGIVGIPAYARLTRGQVLTVKEREFVTAARTTGARDARIIVSIGL